MLDPRVQTCIRAAQSGSLTHAAQELYLSTQAVKKQIDSLEEDLGFALFVRSRRGLTLTEAGRQFVEGAEQLTTQYHQLVSRCAHTSRSTHTQTLTILLPSHPKIYFEEAVMTYNRLYPHVLLDIVDTRKLSVLYDNRARIRTLLEGTADVVAAPSYLTPGDDRLVFCKLNQLHYHCVMKPDHPLSSKPQIRREDLAGFPVRINTVMDREIYDHIIDQEPTMLPSRFLYGERESLRIPLVMSFCLNDGIFITRGDFLETLHPLVSLPFDPPFSVDNGLFYRRDAADHILRFVELVQQTNHNA